MITTTLAVLALAGGLSTGNSPSLPSWQTDYAQAMTRASAERKPMAVFIGHGADTFKKMLAEGTVSTDAARLLRDSYVCLYLDADTATGKDLASKFEIADGLVISAPGGNVQAFRQSGVVTGSELTNSLTQYASAGQPATTVTAGATAAQFVTAPAFVGGCANGRCGTSYQAAPAYQFAPAPQYAIPAGGFYANPSFGGGCANGRCGQR